jgi:DNA primase
MKEEEIIKSVNIADLISEEIELIKRGRQYWGVCPYCESKNIDLIVNPEKQIFYCVNCKVGGNAAAWFMRGGGFNFLEALEFLQFRSKDLKRIVIKKQKCLVSIEREIEEGDEDLIGLDFLTGQFKGHGTIINLKNI